ncbi:hypothetical protein ACHAPT_004187 [Fusarium lateritium]
MGGKAFANHTPPLQTPRMPGAVYHEVKRRVEHRLSKFFFVVRFPIEGPAKQDFGDVDVFVTGPRFQSQGDGYTKREYLDHISAALGATAVIEDHGLKEPSAHFAIPWPRDLEYLCDSPNFQEPTYGTAGPSTLSNTSSQIDPSTRSNVSARIDPSTHHGAPVPAGSYALSSTSQIDPSTPSSFSTRIGTSTHPGASVPTGSFTHGSTRTPTDASTYAMPSTPVTASTPTLPSFPAVPSTYSNSSIPSDFPLQKSRFSGPARPSQRPDWPRSTEIEMTLPYRETRRASGSQQRGGRSRSLPPVSQEPELQFAHRQPRRARSGSARPYSRRGLSRSAQPPFENSESHEDTASRLSRLTLDSDLPSTRPITPARERRLHIQVDVQVFDSPNRLHYMLFHHAHGDIWQLLGNVIKPYGLTVDDKGLWLRIPEIEEADKKRSKVWLSSDPDEILDFLNLSDARYWSGPFGDLHQMYEYVANCITFWVPPADKSEMALRSNDRRRMKQRPAYRKWVEEFKPLCREQGRFAQEPMTRDQVRGRAFARFDVRQTYTNERRAFLVEDQKRHVLKTIIERIVPYPAVGAAKEDVLYRTILVRALKEIVLDWNRGSYSIMAPGNLRDGEGFYHMGRTESFVLEYKDRIGKEAMDLHQRRTRERAHEQSSRV